MANIIRPVIPGGSTTGTGGGSTPGSPVSFPNRVRWVEFTALHTSPVTVDVITGDVTAGNGAGTATTIGEVVDLGANLSEFRESNNIQVFLNGRKLNKRNIETVITGADVEVLWVSSTQLQILRTVDPEEDLEIWT